MSLNVKLQPAENNLISTVYELQKTPFMVHGENDHTFPAGVSTWITEEVFFLFFFKDLPYLWLYSCKNGQNRGPEVLSLF